MSQALNNGVEFNPLASAAWEQEFNAKRRTHDMASEALYLLLLLVPCIYIDISLYTRLQVGYVVFEALLCCTTFWMASNHSRWYVKWRGVLLACRQMLKLTLFYVTFAGSEMFHSIQPLEMPAAFFGRLKFLLVLPISLVQVGT